MLRIASKWKKGDAKAFLRKLRERVKSIDLDRYGREGVEALVSATPVDSGETAKNWYYKIERQEKSTVISFCNGNIQNGVSIAIILQYGHGTRNGGWVEGRDYINPAIQPIFDEIAKQAWKEVTKL